MTSVLAPGLIDPELIDPELIDPELIDMVLCARADCGAKAPEITARAAVRASKAICFDIFNSDFRSLTHGDWFSGKACQIGRGVRNYPIKWVA
jgi:hypothetical protein